MSTLYFFFSFLFKFQHMVQSFQYLQDKQVYQFNNPFSLSLFKLLACRKETPKDVYASRSISKGQGLKEK
jgi:hypothetical protein